MVGVIRRVRYVLAAILITTALLLTPVKSVRAGACTGCLPTDVTAAAGAVTGMVSTIDSYLTAQMTIFQTWMASTFYSLNVRPALQLFTEQMTATAMYQALIIGTFFDAKHQLETQRLLQELQAQAHKDYQPSEDFCAFGTAARGLAASEQIGRFNAQALNSYQMQRQLGNKNAAATTRERDKGTRWAKFVIQYCDPKDNHWIDGKSYKTGLEFACDPAIMTGNTEDKNMDIDYTRSVENPRTIEFKLYDDNYTMTDHVIRKDDIVSLSNNLYGHNILERKNIDTQEKQLLYMALRSVAAKRSVAQNSFDSIVALKTAGSLSTGTGTAQGTNTNTFLGAIMAELGVPAADIYTIIGNDPSYYAQLEILAKKIYQNPDFYANLYDKPANVARKGVALKAIELMLDRAIYESQLRQEMATSVLLSAKLHKPFKSINQDLRQGGEE